MRPSQAKELLRQLPHLEKNNEERIKRATLYHEGLKDLPHIILPPHHTDYSHLYTYYPIQVPDRHALMRYGFEKNAIGSYHIIIIAQAYLVLKNIFHPVLPRKKLLKV